MMRKKGSPPGEGEAAAVATVQGDHETAARYLRVMCDKLEARGQRGYLGTFAPMLGHSLCMLGRYEEAEPLARLGRELSDAGDVLAKMAWRQTLALVEAHRGACEEAERLAREAVAIGQQTDSPDVQADALCDLAAVLRAAGKNAEAAHVLRSALDRYERKKNLAMARQVRTLLRGYRGAGVRPPSAVDPSTVGSHASRRDAVAGTRR
jgi:ATP/maltotriose-dependent transcriptional regulator MalT